MIDKKIDAEIYKHLFEMGRRLLAESEVDGLLTMAMDDAIEISCAERGMIILFNHEGKNIFQTARRLEKEDIAHPQFEISRTIINKVREDSAPVFLQNALEDARLKKSNSVKRLRILSVICLPLSHRDHTFGVVYLDHRKLTGAFMPKIYSLVQEFVNFISLAAYTALERRQLHQRLTVLEKELRNKYTFDAIIGNHDKMVDILKMVSQVADTNATVLIYGESGTGKELIAHALHFNSSRRDKAFVPVNCAALPEQLLESELFGHVRGAFTGAFKEKTGWFEYADGGTIFLDEVGEMSPALQVKLLRVLQTGEYSHVGSTEIRYCDVRIVAATNKNLQKLVNEGRFREDLYYRLNVIEIDIPPLRERLSDTPLLVQHFLEKYNALCGKQIRGLSARARSLLMTYDFPGNVRELENIIHRAVTLAEGKMIDPSHLPSRILQERRNETFSESTLTLTEAKRQAAEKTEKDFICQYLKRTSGHISFAAKIAGVDVGNFHRMMKKHGIDPGIFKNRKT